MLRSEGRTILVDTGVGNGKERPYISIFGQPRTGFLDRLAAAGVRPEDVDLVAPYDGTLERFAAEVLPEMRRRGLRT